jgi:hypothetical protein
MRKATILEEANLLMLMTLPDSQVTALEAIEYMRLRRVEELKKLQRRLAEDEVREANLSTLTISASLHR